MLWRDLQLHPSTRQLREFAGISGIVATGWLLVWSRRVAPIPPLGKALILTGLAVAVVGLLFPRAVRWVYAGMLVLSFPLAFVFNFLALALVFYGVLTPLGLFFRLTRRDALELALRKNQSHWKPVSPKSSGSYFRQY